MVKNAMTIPAGSFHISIEELRKQLKGGNVNVGGSGVTMSKAGAIKVPEGTFHARDIDNGIKNLGSFFGIGEDAIQKARDEARRIYSPAFEEPASLAGGTVMSDNAPVAVGTMQWHEADAERFSIEKAEMTARGFKLIDLYDGRVGFENIDAENKIKITVVCDWQYPLKPPSVFVETNDPIIQLKKNTDGSVVLLSKYMPWKAYMAVCTVVDYLEEKLEMLRDLRDDEEEFGPSEYEKQVVSNLSDKEAAGLGEYEDEENEDESVEAEDEEDENESEADDDEESGSNEAGKIYLKLL